ncbi:MAG: Spy/CpxP family protein refolding chaperone [Candidatus Binatia bacterium]
MKYLLLVFSFLFLFSTLGYADAPLEKTLGLNTEQAKQVQQIQKKYRREFSAKRQELHRERRKLRRARLAHESSEIAQQEEVTAKLREELKQIRSNENEEIRGVLTPEQQEKFEEVLQQRKKAVGSSRDEKDL